MSGPAFDAGCIVPTIDFEYPNSDPAEDFADKYGLRLDQARLILADLGGAAENRGELSLIAELFKALSGPPGEKFNIQAYALRWVAAQAYLNPTRPLSSFAEFAGVTKGRLHYHVKKIAKALGGFKGPRQRSEERCQKTSIAIAQYWARLTPEKKYKRRRGSRVGK